MRNRVVTPRPAGIAKGMRGATRLGLVALLLAGCGGDPAPRPATLDLEAGTYRGVGLGSTRAQAERVLGRATARATDPLAPAGSEALDHGGPPSPKAPREAGAIAVWRFEDAAMAAGRGRAWLLTAAAHDAVTDRGVGVDSDLDDVRAAYPDAGCGTANAGTEYPQFPYCAVQVAPARHVWFGRDPVRSVTVSRAALR